MRTSESAGGRGAGRPAWTDRADRGGSGAEGDVRVALARRGVQRHETADSVDVERLAQAHGARSIEELLGHRIQRIPGDEDDAPLDTRLPARHLFVELHTAHPRHPHVAEHEVIALL